METFKRALHSLIALTLILGGTSFADDPRELQWEELIPGGKQAPPLPIPGHGAASDDIFPNEDEWGSDDMEGLSSTPVYPMGVVEEFNDSLVKLPGFVVPLEVVEDGKVKEFLLVPYFGACIHYPPPPPNQIVYVVLDKAVELESMWDPVWAIGKIKAETRGSELGTAGYTMAGQDLEIYTY